MNQIIADIQKFVLVAIPLLFLLLLMPLYELSRVITEYLRQRAANFRLETARRQRELDREETAYESLDRDGQ